MDLLSSLRQKQDLVLCLVIIVFGLLNLDPNL
jgi:hypothetical protein